MEDRANLTSFPTATDMHDLLGDMKSAMTVKLGQRLPFELRLPLGLLFESTVVCLPSPKCLI